MAKLKLTKATHKKITRSIREGHFTVVAAQLAGISETTLYRWLDAGREAKTGVYREFWEAVEQAKAQAEAKYLTAVRMIAHDAKHRDRLRAATWWLERRHAGRYSPTQITKLEGEIGVRRIASEMTDDELLAKVTEVRRARKVSGQRTVKKKKKAVKLFPALELLLPTKKQAPSNQEWRFLIRKPVPVVPQPLHLKKRC